MMKAASLLRVVLAASVCFGLAFGQAAKPQPHYEITGTLVSSVDGAPIPHGHVVPTLVMRGRAGGQRFPAAENTYDADESGRFVIPLPSAGMWNLSADARGFVRQGYQAHEQFSTGVVLSSAAPAMNIRFVLSLEADITGVVVDEAGEAVRKAQVSLMMVHPVGPDRLQQAASTRAVSQTDDRGEYEFAGVAPGNYRICVRAQPWYALAARSGRSVSSDAASLDPSLDFTYPLTWFPGVDDPDAAETMTVKAGDSRQADFRLIPVPSVHLLIDAAI